jgi:hypothetical protein
MRTLTLLAVTATALCTAPTVSAQIFQNRVPEGQGAPRSGNDAVQVSATGRVQNESGPGFTIQVKNLTYRVTYGQRATRTEVRRGDRVRVVGEITEADSIEADSVLVIERGRETPRNSTVVSGIIRNLDRDNQGMTVATNGGVTTRVTWGEDVEFVRNTTRSGARDFRVGDQVRVIGRQRGNEFVARRVVYGGQVGWVNGGIGEIVGLDARAKEADVDFDGDIWTVKLNNATIRRQGQRAELDDLRLGQDLRVTGTARGSKTVEATAVEVARNVDGPGPRPGSGPRPDNDSRTFEGRVVNVGVNKKGFRLETSDGEVRFQTNSDTVIRRGASDVGFGQLQDGQRLRVQARRVGDEWMALRVTIQ